MKASGIGVRKSAGLIVVTRDDVRIEIAMAITALTRAGRVGGSFEPVVDNTAGLRRIPERVKSEMPGRGRAVIDATVAYIDGKTRTSELRLRETFGCKPGEIAGPGRRITGQVSSHYLVLPFIHFLTLRVGLDRNYFRLRGNLREPFRRQADDNIQIIQNA